MNDGACARLVCAALEMLCITDEILLLRLRSCIRCSVDRNRARAIRVLEDTIELCGMETNELSACGRDEQLHDKMDMALYLTYLDVPEIALSLLFEAWEQVLRGITHMMALHRRMADPFAGVDELGKALHVLPSHVRLNIMRLSQP
jgi:hypothetical protein